MEMIYFKRLFQLVTKPIKKKNSFTQIDTFLENNVKKHHRYSEKDARTQNTQQTQTLQKTTKEQVVVAWSKLKIGISFTRIVIITK